MGPIIFIHQNLTHLYTFVPSLSHGSSDNDDMRNGRMMMCKRTGVMEVKENFFMAEIRNPTRNQLPKISSNATIKQISRDNGSNKRIVLWEVVAMQEWQN